MGGEYLPSAHLKDGYGFPGVPQVRRSDRAGDEEPVDANVEVSAVMQYSLPVVIENSLPSDNREGEVMEELTHDRAGLPEGTAHRQVARWVRNSGR